MLEDPVEAGEGDSMAMRLQFSENPPTAKRAGAAPENREDGVD